MSRQFSLRCAVLPRPTMHITVQTRPFEIHNKSNQSSLGIRAVVGANRRKLAYPNFILCTGISQLIGGSQRRWAREHTGDDFSTLDGNSVSFAPVIPEFRRIVCVLKRENYAIVRITLRYNKAWSYVVHRLLPVFTCGIFINFKDGLR